MKFVINCSGCSREVPNLKLFTKEFTVETLRTINQKHSRRMRRLGRRIGIAYVITAIIPFVIVSYA